MVMYTVKVTMIIETRIGVVDVMEVGDIIKSWSYNDLDDCKRQYKKVVKGLELHGKKMAFKDEFQNDDMFIMMAKTQPVNGKSLWITLKKEEA